MGFPLASSLSSSPTSSSPTILPCPPPPSAAVVPSPCAACKILRRKCTDTCILAPFFPPGEPLKFAAAHKVFGASNIIKLLQGLPESQRGDAVKSVVYEANARLRDPVYGCAGVIWQLQRRLGELQAQVAKAEAELFTVQSQRANLVAVLCMKMAAAPSAPDDLATGGATIPLQDDPSCFLDDGGGQAAPPWELLWA
ncbi:unnamed protein product [Spirodela intermedia]|uniref:LOB domain-containing protein n=1 Tax=Spirodela intermedia TaxID=51605 RepID=A0A7I8JZH1_SPIIN|nr:unnamed protein product [Spirodela intermedia]